MNEGNCCKETECKDLFIKFKADICSRVTVTPEIESCFGNLETVLIAACSAPSCQGGADAAA